MIVSLVDFAGFLFSAAALTLIIVGWNRVELRRDVRTIICSIVAITVFHDFGNVLERSGLTEALDSIGDYLEVFLPLLWGMFFYSILQSMADRDLRRSEQRFRSLVETTSDLVWEVDSNDIVVHGSPKVARLLGITADEINGKSIAELVQVEPGDPALELYREAWKKKKPLRRVESVVRLNSGRKIVLESTGVPIIDEQGKLTGYCGISRDVTRKKQLDSELDRYRLNLEELVKERTRELSRANEKLNREIKERRQVEEKLRQSEEQYRDLFENASDLIQIVRPDGTLLYVNKSWRQTLGYGENEIQGVSLADIIDSDCPDRCTSMFEQIIREGNVDHMETVFVTKDGRKVELEGSANLKSTADGEPESIRCIFRDVTEKRKMENELVKAQKLESIGVFAGGIAHDFNNLLAAFLGNISVAKMYSDPQDKVYERLEQAEKASLRARDLTQQLLTFSKGGEPVKKSRNVSDIIEDAVRFALRGSNVKPEFSVAEDLLWAEVDAGQMGQVAQNLAVNAAQAMPDGGIVSVRLENLTLEKEQLPPLPGGKYIKLTVSDNGIGISKDHLARIFDPYFSTKDSGSGLGLAIAYSVVKKHGGVITVESEENKGTSFHVYLPAIDESIDLSESVDLEKIVKGQGRILVMDDEKSVLEMVGEMLGYLGYASDLVSNGDGVLQKYQEALEGDEPYTTVVMDLTIPGGTGGVGVLKQLKEIDPAVQAIASTGYANDPVMANPQEYGFAGVVAKPYNVEELSKVLGAIVQSTDQPDKDLQITE
jgi:PAS domain S-box-containing protein